MATALWWIFVPGFTILAFLIGLTVAVIAISDRVEPTEEADAQSGGH